MCVYIAATGLLPEAATCSNLVYVRRFLTASFVPPRA